MRKRLLLILAFIAAFLIVLVVCFTSPHGLPPTQALDVIVDCRDSSLDHVALAWEREVGRRFHNAVAVMAHGGEAEAGNWIVQTHPGSALALVTTTQLIHEEEARYPGRLIVLIACNPGHVALHGFPGVYYSLSDIWEVPDKEYIPTAGLPFPLTRLTGDLQNRSHDDPDTVGNVFEFVEAR